MRSTQFIHITRPVCLSAYLQTSWLLDQLIGRVRRKQMRIMYNGLSSWRQNQLVTELHQTRDDASQLKVLQPAG